MGWNSIFSSSVQPLGQVLVLQGGFAQPRESAHHVDRHFHRLRAGQYLRGGHDGAVLGGSKGQVLRRWRARSLRSQRFLGREPEHEIGGEAIHVALDLLIEPTGLRSVEAGQVSIRITRWPRSKAMLSEMLSTAGAAGSARSSAGCAARLALVLSYSSAGRCSQRPVDFRAGSGT
jgi:hypothetical protein